MLTSDHREILRRLALYTTFLAGALSSIAVPAFCELLFGCMPSGDGFVTRLLSLIDFHLARSSYHHRISRGTWQWKNLGAAWSVLTRKFHTRAPALACPLSLYGSFAQSTVLPGTALPLKIPQSDKVPHEIRGSL